MPKVRSFETVFENCNTLNNITFPTLTTLYSSYNKEEYLKNTEEDAWHRLFEVHCEKRPEKADTYNTLLKLSNNDYKNTVLMIETGNYTNES